MSVYEHLLLLGFTLYCIVLYRDETTEHIGLSWKHRVLTVIVMVTVIMMITAFNTSNPISTPTLPGSNPNHHETLNHSWLNVRPTSYDASPTLSQQCLLSPGSQSKIIGPIWQGRFIITQSCNITWQYACTIGTSRKILLGLFHCDFLSFGQRNDGNCPWVFCTCKSSFKKINNKASLPYANKDL